MLYNYYLGLQMAVLKFTLAKVLNLVPQKTTRIASDLMKIIITIVVATLFRPAKLV